MGVFYLTSGDLELDDNVTINGTLVIPGNLTIQGSDIHLMALQQAQIPVAPVSAGVVSALSPNSIATALAAAIDDLADPFNTVAAGTPLTNMAFQPNAAASPVATSFPAVVADGDIVIDGRADVVRVSGLILAGGTFFRDVRGHGNPHCSHDHSISIDQLPNPFATSNGPAVYIRGAVMAGRAKLQHYAERPLALVFDSTLSNVRDAPGFFTWRVAEWTEAN